MSGFSGGCFMAHEMSIIYPSEIQGAVLTCCWNYGDKATLSAASTATELKDASVGLITSNESAGLIGSTSDIANQKIYIWGGADDTVTPPSGQEA
jgi:predicted peptidase